MQMMKIEIKMNLLDEYEKFLLHEEMILQIRQNQYLMNIFLNKK